MMTDRRLQTMNRVQRPHGRAVATSVVGAACLLGAAPLGAVAVQDVAPRAHRGVIGVHIECESGDEVLSCPEAPWVVQVTEGGAAAKAGVRVRDRLVTINDQRINSIEGVRAISSMVSGVAVRFRLERAGQVVQVEAIPQPVSARVRRFFVPPNMTPRWAPHDSARTESNQFVFVGPDERGSLTIRIAGPEGIETVRAEFVPGQAPEAGSMFYVLEDPDLVRRVQEAEGRLRIRAHEALEILTRASGAPRPSPESRIRQRVPGPRFPSNLIAGAKFVSLTPAMAENLGAARSGCLVLRVIPDTPAAWIGLQAGDIVTEVGGTPTGTLAMLQAAFARAETTHELQVAWQRRGTSHNGVLVTDGE